MERFRSLFKKGKKKKEDKPAEIPAKTPTENPAESPDEIPAITSAKDVQKKYKVFISHKQEDSQNLARIIHDKLETKCKVYLDVEDDKPLHDLQKAIRESEYFMIILSEKYMEVILSFVFLLFMVFLQDILGNENGWCRKELEWASQLFETENIVLVLKQKMNFPSKQVANLPKHLQENVFVSKALEYHPGGRFQRAFFEDLEERLGILSTNREDVSFSDYLEPKIKRFTGRKWLLNEVKEWMKLKNEGEKLLIIKGPVKIKIFGFQCKILIFFFIQSRELEKPHLWVN